MLKPLLVNKDHEARPDVVRTRRTYGFFYGFFLALAFALWIWLPDALVLERAHALEPWFKLLVGTLVCLPVGALAGWLTMRVERGWFAAVVWLGAAIVFAWISVALPFQIAPQWLAASHDLPSGFTPVIFDALFVRVWVAYAWVAVFVIVAGVLEMPMSEAAAFSTSFFGRIGPFLLCAALMGITAFMVDNLNNSPFRGPITLTDETIQFVVDNLGREVDPKLRRTMHMSALQTITDLVTEPRQLLIGEYDQDLWNIHVLVRFGDVWVDCLTVYNQMSNCQRMER